MSETPVFTDLRRTFEWTCPECGSDHYDVGEVDGQILTCEGCSKTVLVRWPGLSAEGVVAEEPEWAVSVARSTGYDDPVIYDFRDRPSAERFIENPPLWFSREDNQAKTLVSRRKAGPWVPVMQES